VTAAAQRWNVAPSTCRAQKAWSCTPPPAAAGLRELVVPRQAAVPEKIALKEPADFK